ncbi:hypothetical protein [Mesorhizobium sp. B1-1-5]|uniref:hypothetical protein n=1 Tax=Mesorhizobium sp. B1-1-5 TaxID=2589979 RepID=UPI001128CB36|nr:hypothetical protein [Mesorhizobium sp. B1-1-5]TPO13708.1 hypothetical protein FJ980_00560 [Mesorhizobium sp. B1-1-5]
MKEIIRGHSTDPKEQLCNAVLTGKMTPEEAERQAIELGVELQSTPGDDPMEEPWWSMEMAIAWIVWRQTEGVQSAWTAFRSKCRRWSRFEGEVLDIDFLDAGADDVGASRNQHDEIIVLDGHPWIPPSLSANQRVRGWKLTELKSASLDDLDVEWRKEKWKNLRGPLMDSAAGKNELWIKLAASDLVASAFDLNISEIVDIPSKSWPHLEYGGSGVLGFHDQPGRYQDVRLTRIDVLRLWTRLAGEEGCRQESKINKSSETNAGDGFESIRTNMSGEEIRAFDAIKCMIDDGKVFYYERKKQITSEVNKYIENNKDKFGSEFHPVSEKSIRAARRAMSKLYPDIVR